MAHVRRTVGSAPCCGMLRKGNRCKPKKWPNVAENVADVAEKTINLMHGAADTSPRRQATRKRAHAYASCPGDGAGRLLCGRDARATHTHLAGADAVDEIRKGEIKHVCKTK